MTFRKIKNVRTFDITFDFDHTYIKKRCYASGVYECKSCEISNQIFFNVILLFLKIKDKLVMT